MKCRIYQQHSNQPDTTEVQSIWIFDVAPAKYIYTNFSVDVLICVAYNYI